MIWIKYRNDAPFVKRANRQVERGRPASVLGMARSVAVRELA